MDLTIGKWRVVLAYLLTVLGCLWLNGCDELEPDVDPDNPQFEIVEVELYMTSNGSGFIDLYSMVKARSSVRFDIVSQPRHGSLSAVGKGVFQYTPGSNFRNGKDAFLFQVHSQNNRLLLEDSVVIFVENDTTKFPEGIYPQNDFVYGVTGEVTLNVLQNDILNVSNPIGVELVNNAPGFPPHAGAATVVNGNLIRYIPGNNFNGHDSVFYRVFTLSGPERSGIAKVVIAPAPSCQFSLLNDNFTFDADTLTVDTLWLNIFQNDQLCSIPASSYQFEMLNDGSQGTAFYNNTGSLGYRLPDAMAQNFSDSVTYRICHTQRCEIARAYIEVHH